ncbi:hypothetical protein M8J76_005497 [Diaphorina citri]|nr:hypothetical protein M8J76_005497 [Diaphorina citri]
MNANDAELSLVVPKVVHKLKLRLAVEKLKTLADKSANPTTRQLSGNLTTIRQLSVNRTSKQAPANSTIKQLSANLTTIRQLSVNRTSKQAPANSTIVSQPDNHQAIVSQPYIQASTSQLDNQTIVSQPDNHQTIVSQPYIQASISQLDNQPSVSQPHNEPTIESWTIDLADLSQVNFLHSTSTTGNPLREVLASSCTGSTILGKSELTSADRRFITAAIVEACLKKLNKPSATLEEDFNTVHPGVHERFTLKFGDVKSKILSRLNDEYSDKSKHLVELFSGSLAFDTLLRVGKDDCVLCCAKNLSYIGEIKMGETTYIGRVTVTDGSIHITDASYAHRWMAERQIPFLEMGQVIFTSPGGLDEIIKFLIYPLPLVMVPQPQERSSQAITMNTPVNVAPMLPESKTRVNRTHKSNVRRRRVLSRASVSFLIFCHS